MKKTFALALALTAALAGCGDDVPQVADPHHVQVDGQAMTQQAFLEKYCVAKRDNATCMAVAHAMLQDSSKRGTSVRF